MNTFKSPNILKRLLQRIACAAVIITTIVGCVKNDIPYPREQANFRTFVAEEQERNADIDSINRVITLYFGEQTDLANVIVSDYTISPGAEIKDVHLDSPINIEKPLKVNLFHYYNWIWTIKAVQEISYNFTISGQVGSSVIDAVGHRVVAYVSKNTPISNVVVENIKLGPEGATMTPDITGAHVNFTHPLNVEVTAHDKTTIWTIFVEQTDASVETVRADAWTNVAWIYGQAEVGKDNGIEYRLKDDEDWIRVDKSDLTVTGGSFSASLIHLTPQTTYEARAYSDDAYGATIEFTTGSIEQLPNMSLDNWWLDGKIWCPWLEGEESYWDTGNKGATTIGTSNSVPTDDTATGKGKAAMLETRFVGVGSLGKLAAGNLFVGQYVKTDGTNGILAFGRPFTQRPTKVRGYLKYKTTPINYASTEWESLKGEPDTCVIWCALIDQNEPFEIRTNPRNRQLFNSEGSYVVAYGKIEYGRDVPEYIPFEFELDYKSTQRVPKYILLTASASKYGDYFTGGTGTVLYVDDLELVYDY